MKLKEMIKVRFNLSRGANYMKWKVEYPDGTKEYLSPETHRLIMTKALLKNYKKTAQKILMVVRRLYVHGLCVNQFKFWKGNQHI